MKSAWLGLCFCLLLLQGCSQQKTEQAKDSGTSSNSSTTNETSASAPSAGQTAQSSSATAQTPANSGEPTAEQLKTMPKSQQLFFHAQSSLKANNPKECFDLLEKAVTAANEEKEPSRAIFCRETEAKLKIKMKDQAGATKLMESTIKEYDVPTATTETTMHLDGSKWLLASLYAVNGKSSQAETIYKDGIASAQKQKPVNHMRTASWLKNYADYYGFKKDEKQFKAYMTKAVAESKLK